MYNLSTTINYCRVLCCCLALCRLGNAFNNVGSGSPLILRHSSWRQLPSTSFGMKKKNAFLHSTFPPPPTRSHYSPSSSSSSTWLRMGMDMVTYLRTEWISAALCTNQTPRSANVVLQLGTEDGRAINFIPKTVRELITSSVEADGCLTLSAKRSLKEQQKLRDEAKVNYIDQPSDDLRETPNASVDVVISLTAVDRMIENGLDWKKSVREAVRVLKPGGRLLFVEPTSIKGEESYLEYVQTLKESDLRPTTTTTTVNDEPSNTSDTTTTAAAATINVGGVTETDDKDDDALVFEEVGFDDIDLVLVPHIAGVAIKSMGPPPSPEEVSKQQAQEEQDRLAELSLQAYERGLKKRKKRKVTKKSGDDVDDVKAKTPATKAKTTTPATGIAKSASKTSSSKAS